MQETIEKVLIGLYDESKKKEPAYQYNVSHDKFEIGQELFERILNDLEEEGYIQGLSKVGKDGAENTVILFYNTIKITNKGQKYIKDLENR